jgi:hypothetical protein
VKRFWWVNQNKTYRHEVFGGYLWSPKRKSNGTLNPYYEFMREVSPGDLIFAFAQTLIRALGIASSYAYEAPKPDEFGSAGRDWNDIGWRVDVSFEELPTRFRPADWIELLRPLLPRKYSPLLPDGRGSQSIYLTEVSEHLAWRLADLIGMPASAIARDELSREQRQVAHEPEFILWEEHLRKEIEIDATLDETQRRSLVMARRGQGLFRSRVQSIEAGCRITHVNRSEHLRASHCKPWRDSTNDERLDGENGLLLTPSIDHLFDRGFISFQSDGRLMVSPVAHTPSLAKLGVPVDRAFNAGAFRAGQAKFLEYHRDAVFLQSRVTSRG